MLVRPDPNLPRSLDELLDPALAARLDRLDVRSRRTFPGRLPGERRSKKRGQSVEFADYRPYSPGDDLRHIDWHALARLDKLLLKVFQEEEDLALHLVIDLSASMHAGEPSKAAFALRLAMALGHLGLSSNNRVHATVFGGAALRRSEPMRGRRAVERLGAFLLASIDDTTRAGLAGAAHPPGPGASFDEALDAVARARSGRGVMLLISDFLIAEGYERGLRRLSASAGAGGGYDLAAVQVLAPTEIDPAHHPASDDHPGAPRTIPAALVGDLILVDAETGREAAVTVTTGLLDAYRARVTRFVADLSSFCRARGMAHALLRTDTPLHEAIFEDLRRLGVIG